MDNILANYLELNRTMEAAREGYMGIVERGTRDQVIAARNALILADDALDNFIEAFPEIMEYPEYEG